MKNDTGKAFIDFQDGQRFFLLPKKTCPIQQGGNNTLFNIAAVGIVRKGKIQILGHVRDQVGDGCFCVGPCDRDDLIGFVNAGKKVRAKFYCKLSGEMGGFSSQKSHQRARRADKNNRC